MSRRPRKKMTKKILKYPIPIKDESQIDLPIGSKILSAVEQNDTIVMYAMVNTEITDVRPVTVRVIGTGNLIENQMTEFKFLGTVNMHRGLLMWHVFVRE